MQAEIERSPNNGNVLELIKRYPLAAFFLFAIAFAWSVSLLLGSCLGQDPYVYSHIAGYGPVVAAMLISAAINPKKAKRRFHSWAAAFVLSALAAGTVRWLSRIWWHHSLAWSVLPGDLFLVLLASFVVASAFSGNEGIRSLLRPYLNWRVSWIWYLVAIGLWPGITYIGYILGKCCGLTVPPMPAMPDVPLLLAVLVSFVWTVFFNGAVGEEAGWRGFALPRLQKRYSPLAAGIILGLFWAVFHSIYYFIGIKGNWLMFWVRLGDVALAILFVWLYNRTKGKSLLPVLLMHASINATNDYLPRVKLTVYALLGIVVMIVIFADRMWRREPIAETD